MAARGWDQGAVQGLTDRLTDIEQRQILSAQGRLEDEIEERKEALKTTRDTAIEDSRVAPAGQQEDPTAPSTYTGEYNRGEVNEVAKYKADQAYKKNLEAIEGSATGGMSRKELRKIAKLGPSSAEKAMKKFEEERMAELQQEESLRASKAQNKASEYANMATEKKMKEDALNESAFTFVSKLNNVDPDATGANASPLFDGSDASREMIQSLVNKFSGQDMPLVDENAIQYVPAEPGSGGQDQIAIYTKASEDPIMYPVKEAHLMATNVVTGKDYARTNEQRFSNRQFLDQQLTRMGYSDKGVRNHIIDSPRFGQLIYGAPLKDQAMSSVEEIIKDGVTYLRTRHGDEYGYIERKDEKGKKYHAGGTLSAADRKLPYEQLDKVIDDRKELIMMGYQKLAARKDMPQEKRDIINAAVAGMNEYGDKTTQDFYAAQGILEEEIQAAQGKGDTGLVEELKKLKNDIAYLPRLIDRKAELGGDIVGKSAKAAGVVVPPERGTRTPKEKIPLQIDKPSPQAVITGTAASPAAPANTPPKGTTGLGEVKARMGKAPAAKPVIGTKQEDAPIMPPKGLKTPEPIKTPGKTVKPNVDTPAAKRYRDKQKQEKINKRKKAKETFKKKLAELEKQTEKGRYKRGVLEKIAKLKKDHKAELKKLK